MQIALTGVMIIQGIGFPEIVVKFRFVEQMQSHQSTGHCEPVTDVTGVAISYFSGIYRIFDDKCLKIRGIATASVRTGFAMTIF